MTTTMFEVSFIEKQVMDVFARCTGIFGHQPKRDTERTIDMIWHNIQTHGFFYSPSQINDAVESLIENGLLDMNESNGHLTLTDDGYRFVCGEVDIL